MRWTFGPSFGTVEFQSAPADAAAAPAAPAAPALLDVEVTAQGIADGFANVAIPAYGPHTHNVLAEVRVYAIPEGTALPATADELVNPPAGAPSYPFGTLDTSTMQSGVVAKVPLPQAPNGVHLCPVVLGFAS